MESKIVQIVILIIILMFTGCLSRKDKNENKLLKSKSLKTIILDINLETGFDNDNVKIYGNDKKLFDKTISTDDQDGLAGYLEVRDTLETISIVVKTDSVMVINKGYRIILVNYVNSKLSLSEYSKIPENLIYD